MEDWLSQTRSEAQKAYEKMPWPAEADSPTQQNYTPSKDFDPKAFGAKGKLGLTIKTTGKITAKTLAELNESELSLFKSKFRSLILSSHKMLSFKDAFLENAYLIHAPAYGTGSAEITCTAVGGAFGVHGVVILEEGADASIYEKQLGTNALVSRATEVFSGKNSKLSFDFTQQMDFTSANFEVKTAKLEENSRVVWNTGFFGAKATVARINSLLYGKGANAENYNTYFGVGEQAFDITTDSRHYVPETKGNVLSKGILGGKAQSTYRGLIYIDKKARNTNCFLNGHALLMSEHAKANSVPSLEIHTNDVQSRHGATVEQIDAEKVFYLQTRGLAKKEAEKIIAEGFTGEVFSKSTGGALRDWEEIIFERIKHV